MKKNLFANFGIFMIAVSLAFFSCKRDRVTWDGEIVSTVDNSFADSEFSAIRNLIDTEARADTVIYGKNSGTEGIYCPGSTATVTITGSNTALLTINFGTGATCLDGRLRTGKLNANFTGKWKDPGSTVVVTPENYTVNGYAFQFTNTMTMNGRDANNKLNWTVVVTNAVLTHPTQGTISWNGQRHTTWIEGEGNMNPSTNVYSVTGNANGVARNGLSFTAQVDQPLRVELSCKWIVSGVWSLTPQGREKRTIDYGNTGCDDQAILTVGTYTGNITLP